MLKIKYSDILKNENYEKIRNKIRPNMIKYKNRRVINIGDSAYLYFEDRHTILYQLHEILRVENICRKSDIEEEIHSYNRLIPDGENLKASFMLQFDSKIKRQKNLAQLTNIENKVWIKVGDLEKVYAQSNEDIDYDKTNKTFAVHFLRFQLHSKLLICLANGESLGFGIDHENYSYQTNELSFLTKSLLLEDLDLSKYYKLKRVS